MFSWFRKKEDRICFIVNNGQVNIEFSIYDINSFSILLLNILNGSMNKSIVSSLLKTLNEYGKRQEIAYISHYLYSKDGPIVNPDECLLDPKGEQT